MIEENFYKNVHASLANFQPEVPASVYRGVRKKMWLTSFTTFQLTRFNMWYVLATLALAGSVYGISMNKKSMAEKAITNSAELPSTPVAKDVLASPDAAVIALPVQSRNEACTKPKAHQANVASCSSAVIPEQKQTAVADATSEKKPEAQQEVGQQDQKAVPAETQIPAPKGKRLIVPVWVDDNK